VFDTSDGHINIAATGKAIYERFCAAMKRPDWLTDERFHSPRRRLAHRDEMNAQIEAITRTKTSAEWLDLFDSASVPAGPIYAIDEVFADPQVQHLGMAESVSHPVMGEIELVSQPIRMDAAPFSIPAATPELGQHNAEILGELGFSAAEIDALHKAVVV